MKYPLHVLLRRGFAPPALCVAAYTRPVIEILTADPDMHLLHLVERVPDAVPPVSSTLCKPHPRCHRAVRVNRNLERVVRVVCF
jgi:hypothetical protein